MKIKLIWQLFPTYIFLVIFSIVSVIFFMWDAVKRFHIDQTVGELKAKAVLLEEIYSKGIEENSEEADVFLKKTGSSIGTRITLISPDGRVFADSEEDIRKMENHAGRPEVVEALKGGKGVSTRYSSTLRKDMLYVAIPFIKNGEIKGVTRTSLPALSMTETLKPMTLKFMIAGVMTAFISIFFSFLFSMFIIKPLKKILKGVEQFGQGELDGKLDESITYEFAKLAENMNQMAVDLKYRLNTITRQRNELARLENIRKEFVANVSHELRTPITSIKGYIETLRDGAIDDRENALEFIEVISRQTERLNSIIEDLLCLSRIEKDNESKDVEISVSKVSPVLINAVHSVSSTALRSGITLKIDCPDDLSAKINPRLLEQAVINLIDNAIKYSEQESTVEISAYQDGGKVTVKVKDYGCGIEKEHLDRLFER
ncbi:MAG TPA: histidine kinase dimerization/phospho-acceptor domain-containing protein, partial [bacterium]|nr:histidine kinase dimerization/phospho-acceptor domain-containing protein [bacterium]